MNASAAARSVAQTVAASPDVSRAAVCAASTGPSTRAHGHVRLGAGVERPLVAQRMGVRGQRSG